MSLRKNFVFLRKLRGTVSSQAMCYPTGVNTLVWEYHYKLESKLKKPDSHRPWVGFEKVRKIVIFRLFPHPHITILKFLNVCFDLLQLTYYSNRTVLQVRAEVYGFEYPED